MVDAATDVKPLIRLIREADWSPLEQLWLALYQHQREHGMLIELAPNAYQLWAASIKPLAGRFAFVLVAEKENTLVGFLAGRIRSLPPQFVGHQTGHISEVFVSQSERQHGVASELLSAAIEWFGEHEIYHVDMPVLARNTHAREFYLRRGWVEELVQMVWQQRPIEPDR